MEDNDKTKKQLINELIEMRRKVAELEVIKNGHKRIEKALKESEERYRSLFEASTEGILIADIETMRLKYANSALSKMLGYSEEELKK